MRRAQADQTASLLGRRRFLLATATIGIAGVGSSLLRPRPAAASGLPAANSELTMNVAAAGATLTVGGQSGSVDLSGKIKVKAQSQQSNSLVLAIEAFAMTGNGKPGEVDLVEARPDRSQPTTLEQTQGSSTTYKLTLNIDFFVAVKPSGGGNTQALQSKQPVTYTADDMTSFPPSGQQLQGPSSVDLVSPDKMDTVVGTLSNVSIKLG